MAEHRTGDGQPGSGGRAADRRAATGPRRRKAPARTSPLVVAGRVVVCAASAAVLVVSGLSWYAYHSLTSGLTTSSALDAVNSKGHSAAQHLDGSVNLLLIGLDSRKDMNGNDLPAWVVRDELHAGSSSAVGGYNTNTLILMHIPAGGGKVTAFSIPRDDYVETLNGDGTSQGHHKIKEAYGLAKAAAETRLTAQGVTGKAELEARSREIGREATLATVQNFLGVRIDHFAEVNLIGFYDIAKVLEPITVCLKQPVHDSYSGAAFPAGLQQLNAGQALAFVRQRHGLTGGDLDRTHRQQAFLSSVVHKLKTQGVIGDLGKLQSLFGVVKKDVVIDSRWNVLDFAQQAPNLTGGNVEFNTLPITGFATRNGESVNLVDPNQVQGIVNALIGHDPAPAPTASGSPGTAAPAAAPATVDVFNGSGVTGAAGAELTALAKLGYTAGRTGNAAHHAATTVTYGAGAQTAAQQIASRLGATATARTSVPAGHVVVILGAGFTPPGQGSSGSSPGSSPGGAPATGTPPAKLVFQGTAVKMGGIPCVN